MSAVLEALIEAGVTPEALIAMAAVEDALTNARVGWEGALFAGKRADAFRELADELREARS